MVRGTLVLPKLAQFSLQRIHFRSRTRKYLGLTAAAYTAVRSPNPPVQAMLLRTGISVQSSLKSDFTRIAVAQIGNACTSDVPSSR